MRCSLQVLAPWIATRMIPCLPGFTVTVTLPFWPVVTVLLMPGPVILTVAPATGFLAFVTVTLIFCAFPFPFNTFGVTVNSSQISGCGFGVGGVTGAVTTVEAEAVLFVVFVSG